MNMGKSKRMKGLTGGNEVVTAVEICGKVQGPRFNDEPGAPSVLF
jgi:hypothetical protein